MRVSKLIPRFVTCLIISSLFIFPFKALSHGFFPCDDALRHSAKVISGKDWNEILVLRDSIRVDSHPGWHAVLWVVRSITNWNVYQLVVFSVIALFIMYSLVPIFFLRRPEAWIFSFMIIALANSSVFYRMLIGRPYIVTMSVFLVIGFLWPKLKSESFPSRTSLLIIVLITLSTWIHCRWYLFALPVFSFFLAREWRAGLKLAICTFIGIILGASFTGNPILFLRQTLDHLFLAFGSSKLSRMLVGEFQPFSGEANMVIAVLLILVWRDIIYKSKTRTPKLINDPIFLLAVTCWVLGFVSRRNWFDLGIPAVSVWMAREFQEFLDDKMNFFSRKRILVTALSLWVAYYATLNSMDSRWQGVKLNECLSSDDPEISSWLPGEGGVVYSDTSRIFYEMFYRNPRAPWRYMVGFEPALMPAEDLVVFRNIQLTYKSYASFEPWVKKMKPMDRLIVRNVPGDPACITGLEWRYTGNQTWIGRLRRNTR